MPLVYEELIDFLAAGTTPQSLIAFKPSAATKARVEELVRRQKLQQTTPTENSELNHYLELEHLMRLAKARARLHAPQA
jgi:hypothetical protein